MWVTLKKLIAPLLLVIPCVVAGQPTANAPQSGYSLKGRHSIDISIGLLSNLSSSSDVTSGGVNTSSTGNGFLGSIVYAYWLEDDLAVGIRAGVQNADAKVTVTGLNVSTQSAAVVPLLFGIKYQIFRFTQQNTLRPYISVYAGPYFGFASNVRTGLNVSTESISEAAIGSRLAADFDLLLSRRFKLGIGVGYRLVSDFHNRIGTQKNYSSPEFSMCFGFILGRGKK